MKQICSTNMKTFSIMVLALLGFGPGGLQAQTLAQYQTAVKAQRSEFIFHV